MSNSIGMPHLQTKTMLEEKMKLFKKKNYMIIKRGYTAFLDLYFVHVEPMILRSGPLI